jgi:Ca2+-binding RTX toxin-like protein
VIRRVLIAVIVAAFVGGATSVFTAGVSVPTTYLSATPGPDAIDDQAPASCAGGLTNVVNGATGTAANDLVLHGSSGTTVRGQGGDDCVLGGGGNDSLQGNAGTDVCIGGPGTDTFATSCETRIQ